MKFNPLDVLGQPRRHFAIAQRAIVLLGNTHPRAEVHLINRHRCIKRVATGALIHPLAVGPLVVEIPDYRCGSRRDFVVTPNGSAFAAVYPWWLETI